MLSHFADPAWQREATAAEEDRIVGLLEAELSEGSLGIGVLVGYAPGTSLGEYLRVARLAASSRVPTYTHARDLVDFAPDARMDGAEELVHVVKGVFVTVPPLEPNARVTLRFKPETAEAPARLTRPAARPRSDST